MSFSWRTRINLKFSELTYDVPKDKESKRILKGVSGRFLSGQISAILGPSGAGKTTLMNILAGHKKMKISGEILVNGKPRCLKSFQKQSCYIMQDEHLLKYLTVQESMDAAAALKIGKSCQDLSVKSTIDEILSALGLEETKDTRVSNLSGGERKRLSIAFEFLSKPPIMFLDEPTRCDMKFFICI
ncbi:ABC transporter G family member 22 [Armadillidium nasatum]|uniref:ABC transporter G family member 22 n=1 Tax=Armadillidium nasatum TaxID=96803 RepID=A0A5N5T5U9_9CRUS|nr:ABC transporter G family member 22 [Armadillidium nasatum]